MKLYPIIATLKRLGLLSPAVDHAATWGGTGELKHKIKDKAAYFPVDKGQPKGKEIYEPYGFYGFRIPGTEECYYLCDFAKLRPYQLFEKEPEDKRVVEKCLIPITYLTPENFTWDWTYHFGRYVGPVEEVIERVTPEDTGYCHKCLKPIGREEDWYTEGYYENPAHYCQHPENQPPPYEPEPQPEPQPYEYIEFDDGIPF